MKKYINLCLAAGMIFTLGATGQKVNSKNIIANDLEFSTRNVLDNKNGFDVKRVFVGEETNAVGRTFSQVGVNTEGKKVLRFATPVSGDVESLNYNITVEGYQNEITNTEVTTVYKSLLAGESLKYFDGESVTDDASYEGKYYWACFCITFTDNSTYKDAVITASLDAKFNEVEETTTSAVKKTSLKTLTGEGILNGNFETGDLTGWETYSLTGEKVDNGTLGNVSSSDLFFLHYDYLKNGNWFYEGLLNGEDKTGYVASTVFTVSELNVSCLFGAAKNSDKNKVMVVGVDQDGNPDLNTVYGTIVNNNFRDPVSAQAMSFTSTKLDESALNKQARVVFYDNAANDFGFNIVDDVKVNLSDENVVEEKQKFLDRINTIDNFSSDYIHYIQSDDKEANYKILNGSFETGDLTGWEVLSGNVNTSAAVSGETVWWVEQIPFMKEGNFFFNGWTANTVEAEGYSLKSTTFTLGGSGQISFKLGGNAAYVKVYKLDGTLVGHYTNTEFKDASFPNISGGMRLANMVTYVADLSSYVGEKLYIEIGDDSTVSGWAIAMFDDIKTYYAETIDVSEHVDHYESYKNGEVPAGDVAWVTAVNQVE